jgi:hypothetical protein
MEDLNLYLKDVLAKWGRTARQYKLNIYSNKPYNLIWEHG